MIRVQRAWHRRLWILVGAALAALLLALAVSPHEPHAPAAPAPGSRR